MNSLHVTSNREKIAMRISWYSIAVNVFLSLGKFVAGIFGHSAAMVSDAIHSASDVFATFIVMAGIKISGRASEFLGEESHAASVGLYVDDVFPLLCHAVDYGQGNQQGCY